MAATYNQTTVEADARLIEFEGDPQIAGAVLKRGWPKIAGQAAAGDTVNELVLALNAVTTYTNPKANNKAYGGTYVNSVTRALDEFERSGAMRDCSIVQTLTKIRPVANAAALFALTPRFRKRNEIVKGFELNYGEWDLYEFIYENLDPANETVLRTTITKLELVTNLALGASEPADWVTATG